jgi:hypothetical protein
MGDAMKSYLIYGLLTVSSLGIAYASVDYAINGPKTKIIQTYKSSNSSQGTIGITHSWIQNKSN